LWQTVAKTSAFFLPSALPLEIDVAMNEITATLHGLKAASQLLLLIKDDVSAGRLQLRNVAIDFEDGTSREFSAEEYVALAQDGVARAVQIVGQAAAGD
jgi:hypothetical protein